MNKIDKINQVLAEYFKKNSDVSIVPAKDLMKEFVAAGVFPSDSERPGLPIRKLLRELDSRNELGQIPYVWPVRKAQNTYWYFRPLT